jgi:hypothetical protein
MHGIVVLFKLRLEWFRALSFRGINRLSNVFFVLLNNYIGRNYITLSIVVRRDEPSEHTSMVYNILILSFTLSKK